MFVDSSGVYVLGSESHVGHYRQRSFLTPFLEVPETVFMRCPGHNVGHYLVGEFLQKLEE